MNKSGYKNNNIITSLSSDSLLWFENEAIEYLVNSVHFQYLDNDPILKEVGGALEEKT